MQSKVGKETE